MGFVSGANGNGTVAPSSASGPPARVEGNGEVELLTPKQQIQAIDDEIAELQRERDKAVEQAKHYSSPEQVEARRARRVRYLGEAALASPLDAALVERAREVAGKERWLFEPAKLAEDGVECEPVEEGGG